MIDDVSKMAMRVVVVETQHLVSVLYGLRELARPTAACASSSVSHDQQVGITSRFRHIQHLLRPQQRLRCAPLRQDVHHQSPQDGYQRVVALECFREGKRAVNAGAKLPGGRAYEAP